VPPLLKMFKLPDADAYSTKAIFQKVWQVVSGVGEILGFIVKEYPSSGDPKDPLGVPSAWWENLPSSSYQL
jgi:hypothetical protein